MPIGIGLGNNDRRLVLKCRPDGVRLTEDKRKGRIAAFRQVKGNQLGEAQMGFDLESSIRVHPCNTGGGCQSFHQRRIERGITPAGNQAWRGNIDIGME